jgi:hypothetical protein
LKQTISSKIIATPIFTDAKQRGKNEGARHCLQLMESK